MDASTASADSSTGHESDKTLVSSSLTPLSDHGREIAPYNLQTFNESQTMHSESVGSAAPLGGITMTSVICNSSSTTVSSGPVVAKGPYSTMMPMSSNNAIQTPLVNSQHIVAQPESQAPRPTVTFTMPPMQAAGSGVTFNENSTVSSAVGFSSTCHIGIASQPSHINNSQQSSPVSVRAGSHIIKAEPPTTTIQPAPQSTVIPSAPRIPTTFALGSGRIRAPTPQMLAPRLPQTSTGQLGVTNVQVPAGMVIVRYDGRLLMIPQQTLAQIQSQGGMAPRSTTPANMAPGQAPGNTIINRQINPSTIIRQGGPAPTSLTVTTALQRPPILQNSMWAPAPGMTPTTSQTARTTTSSITLSKDTMENVKKCKSFLSTLIKLVSNGKESAETAADVRGLVKDLLEEKVEPEEFTSRLYTRLKSTPQPYLVPFLKRSLPALRQLTPDSAAFIQQSQLPQLASAPSSSTPTHSTVDLGIPGPHLTGPGNRPQLQSGLSQPGQTASMVLQPQQQRAMLRPPVPFPTTTMVTLRNQAPGHIMVRQQHVQPKGLQPALLRPQCPPVSRQVCTATLSAAQKSKLKEAGGTFKDDDDINDVASMAGVNLTEESDNILATTYGLVGSMTRSCKDEAFLSCSILQRRILEIGKRHGVTDLGAEVVNYVSHATQQRLQNLLEKVSQVAQQRNINFKQEDGSYDQSSDVRAQLKYFEHLDQIEKQRKEEEEREILLKAAKSRARQEDPEQLRLKQKAKEMQQQELAQMRYREANQTALAAIGPRKKRTILDHSSHAAAEGTLPGAGPSSCRPTRQRITRVNLRDLLFVLENDRFASHSLRLYKGFLK